jgi:hypothetical protein
MCCLVKGLACGAAWEYPSSACVGLVLIKLPRAVLSWVQVSSAASALPLRRHCPVNKGEAHQTIERIHTRTHPHIHTRIYTLSCTVTGQTPVHYVCTRARDADPNGYPSHHPLRQQQRQHSVPSSSSAKMAQHVMVRNMRLGRVGLPTACNMLPNTCTTPNILADLEFQVSTRE